jgi:predicted alpha/beta superfamily hydrolase
MHRRTVPSSSGGTRVEVVYPPERGRIGLRGSHAPLSWEHTHPADSVDGDRHYFHVQVPRGEILELKVVRDDGDWAAGHNYAVHAGDHVLIEPAFDRSTSRLEAKASIADLEVEVLLPPSYDEQTARRYPVVYALDGQALFSTSQDPYGVWGIDGVLDALYDVEAVDELILVGIHTAERRLERLSPIADAKHGGGEADAFLAQIVDRLRPAIGERYRTLADRDHTAILGSSMGGLFAFHAAWSRPDVFGKAACLSSSFWWATRWAVRRARGGPAPDPRPVFYLDSGAAPDPMEPDPNVRDGFHHTRAMFRALTAQGFTPGVDLHRLVFPGQPHEPKAWGSRVGLPLQILFPPERVIPER